MQQRSNIINNNDNKNFNNNNDDNSKCIEQTRNIQIHII